MLHARMLHPNNVVAAPDSGSFLCCDTSVRLVVVAWGNTNIHASGRILALPVDTLLYTNNKGVLTFLVCQGEIIQMFAIFDIN